LSSISSTARIKRKKERKATNDLKRKMQKLNREMDKRYEQTIYRKGKNKWL
jgi:hypothetical protein